MSSEGGAPLRHEGGWLVGTALGAGLLAGLGWALLQYLTLVERIAAMAPYFDQMYRVDVAWAAWSKAHPDPSLPADPAGASTAWVPQPTVLLPADSVPNIVAAGLVVGVGVASFVALAGLAVRRGRSGWALAGALVMLLGFYLAGRTAAEGADVTPVTMADALMVPTVVVTGADVDPETAVYGSPGIPLILARKLGIDPATLIGVPAGSAQPWWLVVATWGLVAVLLVGSLLLLRLLPGRRPPHRSSPHLRRHEAAVALLAAAAALCWIAVQDGSGSGRWTNDRLVPAELVMAFGVAVVAVAAGSATRRPTAIAAAGLACAAPALAAIGAAFAVIPGGPWATGAYEGPPQSAGFTSVLLAGGVPLVMGMAGAAWGRGARESWQVGSKGWHRWFAHGPALHLRTG